MPAQVYVHHVLVGSPEWWKRVWDVLKVVLLLNSKDYCIILACSKGSGRHSRWEPTLSHLLS